MTIDTGLRRTPLYEKHRALGARMVPFAGWEMPIQYAGIVTEHRAVRGAAGLFDLSHMGEFWFEGVDALSALDHLISSDVGGLPIGHARYGLLTNEQGTIVDDVIAYRVGPDRVMVVVNASNIEKDAAHVRRHLPSGVRFDDKSMDTALIAPQGPRAAAVLSRVAGMGVDDLMPFGVAETTVGGAKATVARTGYTGEDGFEIFVESAQVGHVWDAILEKGRPSGALPAGLGARDATRLEAALRLYGNEMDETVNPYEAGLGWTVKLTKTDFIGRDALATEKQNGPRRTLIGLETDPGIIPRHGAAILRDGRRTGLITSGTHSFFLGHPIALAMVEVPSFPVGATVAVEVRGREAPAKVVKLPFYRGSARSAVSPAIT